MINNIDYKDYEKLIYKISWNWNKTTAMDIEELIPEANIVFAECLLSHNPSQSKFSTWLYISIQSRFKVLLNKSKCMKYDGVQVEFKDEILSNSISQEKNCLFKNIIDNLSKEAKEIAITVLEAPADLLEMLPKPELSKNQLMKYFRLKGWKIPAIQKAFAEIKESLNF